MNKLQTILAMTVDLKDVPCVEAEVHDDNNNSTAKFNAAEYLSEATKKDWLDLIACDFGGDYAADEVALFFNNQSNPSVQEVFSHTGGNNGFECHINKEQALAFLGKINPELLAELISEKVLCEEAIKDALTPYTKQ